MKWSDVFSVPFVNWKIPFFLLWLLYVVITFFPGLLLSICTLGMFRYFHLSKLFCDWLIQKDIEKNGFDWV